MFVYFGLRFFSKTEDFFQKLMNLYVNSCQKTGTFANVHEKRSDLISQKMTNDEE